MLQPKLSPTRPEMADELTLGRGEISDMPLTDEIREALRINSQSMAEMMEDSL